MICPLVVAYSFDNLGICSATNTLSSQPSVPRQASNDKTLYAGPADTSSDAPQRYLRHSRTTAPSSQPTAVFHYRATSADQVSTSHTLRQVPRLRTAQSERDTELPSSREIDRAPPFFSEITRLILLKDDYCQSDSTSRIVRSKINYLRFEAGYRGLRRVRGDGNCFYRCT